MGTNKMSKKAARGRDKSKRGGKEPKVPNFDPRHFQRPGCSLDEIEEIKEAFDMFDSDGSGSIEVAELKAAMTKLGFDGDNELATKMIDDLDADKSGEIEFDEFLDMMSAKMPDDPTKDEVSKVFPAFDKNKSGVITKDNLKQVIRELGQTMSDDEIDELIEHTSSSNNGEVTLDDFYNIITKKTFP